MRGSPNTPERFWDRVDRSGGPDACWPWTGAVSRGRDYRGAFSVRQRHVRSHRFAWELVRGPIPAGLSVLHACDNSLCCNPAHLFLGTQADNQADMASKGRSARGIRNARARLTDSAVLAMRAAYAGNTPVEDIASRYGVALRTAYRAIRGDDWTHIPGACAMRPRTWRRQSA